MNEVKINVLQWNGYDVDGKHRIVGCGRDTLGKRASFVVNDYPICVYLQLDKSSGFAWSDKIGVSAVTLFFNAKFGHNNNKRSLSNGWHKGGAPGPKVVSKHGVKDVLRDKDFFIECFYCTQNDISNVKNLLELKTCCITINNNKYRVQIAHDTIEPVKKLTISAKLPWTGWINCKGTIKKELDPTKITTQEVEIHCSWKDLHYDDITPDIVAESVLFHDIECLGIGNQFSNKYNPLCPITQISFIERDPNRGVEQYYCIVYGDAISRIREGAVAIVYNVVNERDLLCRTLELIRDTDCDVISGYNILGFDLDYIYYRCVLNNVRIENWVGRIKDLPCKYYDKTWSSSNSNKVDVKYIDMPGRIYLDVFKVAKSNLKLSNYKLNTVANDQGVGSKVDVTIGEMFDAFRSHQRLRTALGKCIKSFDDNGEPIPHDNLNSVVWCRLLQEYHQSAVRLQEIIYYCIVDTELSMKLYDIFKYMQTAREFANVFQIRISEVYTTGQGFRALSLLFTMLCEEGVILNTYEYELFADKYEGALNLGTLYNNYGLHRKMASLDVVSMYPSQMCANNISLDTELTEEEANGKFKGLCKEHSWKDYEGTVKEKSYKTWLVHSSVRRGWFTRLLDNIIARRRATKKLMNAHIGLPQYSIYNSRQLALKQVANSVYGLIGSNFSKTPCKQLASLVTYLARKTLMVMVNFLVNGGPPDAWLTLRNADKTKPPYPDKFFAATMIYGDTDSVQFNYPQITWKNRATMATYYIDLTKGINDYLYPIVVELEKIGDIHLEGAKHYAIRLIDQTPTLSQGIPNPRFGEWKEDINIVGIDTVKRNQAKFHRECLSRIIRRILDSGSVYEKKYADVVALDHATLRDNVDDIVSTLYKVYMGLFAQTDYEIYEAYNKEGAVSNIGSLARRQSELGRPIMIGERVGYVMVRFVKETNNSSISDKARIVGDFDLGDTIDSLYYVNRMETPYDTTMNTRYARKTVFIDFWKSCVPLLNKKLQIADIINNPTIEPNKLFCDVLRTRLSKTAYSNFLVPEDYNALMALRESHTYVKLYTQSVRTQITKNINNLLNEGWSLVLTSPNIVEKFLMAIQRECLQEFIKAVLSTNAYDSLGL